MRHGLLGAALLACAADGAAQLYVPGQGEGSVSVQAQVVTDHTHFDYRGNEIGESRISTQSLQLKLDYGLTDRLALSASAPYLRKRFVRVPGGAPPHEDTFGHGDHDHEHAGFDFEDLDDNQYHGHWQDFSVALRYRWIDAPVAITPFVSYGWPSHDYTFYAHAAPGTRQNRFTLGSFLGRRFGPPWQNTYLQGYYSYTFVEEVLGIKPNYSTLYLELGHAFNERWGARLHATYRKTHEGLDFPVDFPWRGAAPAPEDLALQELFFHHDRIQRVDYLNLGLGGSYALSERYSLSLDWMTTAWGENGHKIHNAVTLGLYRSF